MARNFSSVSMDLVCRGVREKKDAPKCDPLHNAPHAQDGSLRSFPITHTIMLMELVKVIAEVVIDWIRETLVNVGGRIAEEFIGKRLKRRKRRSKSQRKSGPARFAAEGLLSPRRSTVVHVPYTAHLTRQKVPSAFRAKPRPVSSVAVSAETAWHAVLGS